MSEQEHKEALLRRQPYEYVAETDPVLRVTIGTSTRACLWEEAPKFDCYFISFDEARRLFPMARHRERLLLLCPAA